MRPTPARTIAAQVVERVLRDEAWAQNVLDSALRAADMDRREAAFATRLTYGTVELLPTVRDAVRDRADRTSRIKPRVMAALAVATYEILALDTPAAIAVDQGVALVKATDPHAAGFANAVLRRVADDAASFPWGDPDTDLGALARETGFTSLLAHRLADDLGEATARAVMRGSVGAPPMYLAVNPMRSSAADVSGVLAGLEAMVRECLPDGCLVCDEPATVRASGVLDDGRAIVSDRAAQIVASIVPIGAGSRIVDCASGRGSKSALLAFAAHRAGVAATIEAVDVHEWKCKVVRERMELLGVSSVRTHALDATDPDALRTAVGSDVDAVLIDAPCTNLGTLRRHPEGRWRFDGSAPESLARLGTRLFAAAAQVVRPGGFMVYSTCTVLPQENKDVVTGFLASSTGEGFSVVDIADRVPPDVRSSVSPEGFLQTLPRSGEMDGHFAVLLQREE